MYLQYTHTIRWNSVLGTQCAKCTHYTISSVLIFKLSTGKLPYIFLFLYFLLTAPTQLRPLKVNKYCLYFLKRQPTPYGFDDSNHKLAVLFVNYYFVVLLLAFLLWATSADKTQISAMWAFFCCPASFGTCSHCFCSAFIGVLLSTCTCTCIMQT